MTTFADYIKLHWNVEIPHGVIPGSWFSYHGIPMVVRCSCCDMTMASPSAWMDDEGYTYCADCAGVEKEG